MKTVRRPPYPKWNPGYFPCSSLTPLPLSSRRPSVSFGGFGLRNSMGIDTEGRLYSAPSGTYSFTVLGNQSGDEVGIALFTADLS